MRHWHSLHTVRLTAGLITLALHMSRPHSARGVTLGWDPGSGPGVTGYMLYYGVGTHAYTKIINVGNVTNASISGLVDGVTYYFSLTAYNSQMVESDFSNETSCTQTSVPPVNAIAPIAGTLAASTVTESSATVGGLLNAQGSPTTAWFDWGKTTNFTSKTMPKNIGNGIDTVSDRDVIAGLLPGTAYYFRIVATNCAGTAAGGTLNFKTAAVSPTVSTQPPSGINWKAATLNGSVNPNGAATTARFEYGLSTNYGTATPLIKIAAGTTAVTVSASISGLLAGTEYHFRLIGSNVVGRTVSADSIFLTGDRHLVRK